MTVIKEYILIDPVNGEAMCDPQSYEECEKERGEAQKNRLVIAEVTWKQPEWIKTNG